MQLRLDGLGCPDTNYPRQGMSSFMPSRRHQGKSAKSTLVAAAYGCMLYLKDVVSFCTKPRTAAPTAAPTPAKLVEREVSALSLSA